MKNPVKKILISFIIFGVFNTNNLNFVRSEAPVLTFSTANSTESTKKICENCAEQIKNLEYRNSLLVSENEKLKHSKNKYKKRARTYKQELDSFKTEFYRAKSELLTEILLELNKKHGSKTLDANGLFSKFINFDIKYTNNGNTEIAPGQNNVNAKTTVAGAAMTV